MKILRLRTLFFGINLGKRSRWRQRWPRRRSTQTQNSRQVQYATEQISQKLDELLTTANQQAKDSSQTAIPQPPLQKKY